MIFPTWNPNLNKKHFPRSADSEWVAVLAGQRDDGVIVPISVSLVDGTTNQYALAANTEISVPPITIGKVVVQGVDYGGAKHDIQATPNPDGTWSMSITSPTLASEASQLTEIGLIQNLIISNSEGMTNIINALNGLSITIGDINVNTDELELLMRLNTATMADGMTLMLAAIQSSTISIQDGLTDLKIELLEGMTNIVTLVAQEVVQLSTLESLISQQITQLSDLQLRAATEITQLSILQELQGLCVNINSNALAQEVTQLSVLYELSNLSVSIGKVDVNTDQLEELTRIQTATIAGGFTDTEFLMAQEVAQLSDLQARLATEETQLSIFQELAGLCVNINSGSLAQEVTQLSILQEIAGLCVNINSATLNQEVTQLSVLTAVEGLSITQTPPHGQYYVFEGTQATGLSDVLYDFGGLRMEDVYLTSDANINVRFESVANSVMSLTNGTFGFSNQNAHRIYVSTNGVAANLQIYANGGF